MTNETQEQNHQQSEGNLEKNLKLESFGKVFLKTLAPIYGEVYHWKNTLKGSSTEWKIISTGIIASAKYYILGDVLYNLIK